MKVPQFGAGLDAEFLDKHAPGLSERRQGVALPAAPVEREHELAAEPFPQRMLTYQPSKLRRRRGVLAKREHDLDALLNRCQPLLDKPYPADLDPGAGNPSQRGRLPQQQRRVEGRRRASQVACRTQCTRCVQMPAEYLGVKLAGFQPQQVPRPAGQQDAPGGPVGPIRLQRDAQPRHVDMEGVHRAQRRIIAPHPVDELVARDRPVRAQRQQPKHRPPPWRAQIQFLAPSPGPYRAEQLNH